MYHIINRQPAGVSNYYRPHKRNINETQSSAKESIFMQFSLPHQRENHTKVFISKNPVYTLPMQGTVRCTPNSPALAPTHQAPSPRVEYLAYGYPASLKYQMHAMRASNAEEKKIKQVSHKHTSPHFSNRGHVIISPKKDCPIRCRNRCRGVVFQSTRQQIKKSHVSEAPHVLCERPFLLESGSDRSSFSVPLTIKAQHSH